MRRAAFAVAAVAAVAALGALAALGGRFGEPDAGTATLWITRDDGRLLLQDARVPAGLTALQALDRVADVRTRYGGRYVQAVDGLDGSALRGQDWLYYVNGVYADRGAATYRLRDGDVLWWDFHRWAGTTPRTVLVGAFPEPLLHGFAGRTRPAHVRYARGLETPARALGRLVHATRVAPLGVAVPRAANVLEVRAGAPSLRASAASVNGPYRFVLRGPPRDVSSLPQLVRRHEVWPR